MIIAVTREMCCAGIGALYPRTCPADVEAGIIGNNRGRGI